MGVIHRDVKPGNILCSDDGAVKLADFGIAKAMSAQTSQITQAGSVLGTAAYLAPEQALGGDVGPRADLYGLGVVTYQMLSGRLPYDAGSLTELAMLQQRQHPPRLDEVTGDVPVALALAVERALALDPDERYGGAEEMRKALHDGERGIGPDATAATSMLPSHGREPTAATRALPTARSRRIAPQPPLYPPPPPAPQDPAYEPRPERLREPTPRGRGGGVLKGLAVVLVGGLIAAAIAYAVGTSQGGQAVTVRPIDGNSTGEIMDQMESLIDDNTR
jgi:serine/threonine-protein kinase